MPKIDSIFYSYGPFIIMILANGVIIYKFIQASCTRDQGGTQSTNQALSKSTNKGTAMLITVSITFLILTLPVTVIREREQQEDIILLASFVLLRYTNHSINAVLYCISGSRFRNELMKTYPFRFCTKSGNKLCRSSQSVSSLTGNSTRTTMTSNGNVTANPI